MNKRSLFDLAFFVCLWFIFLSCEQPASSFRRSNTNDPLSENFVPSKTSKLAYEINNGTLILSWKDESDFEDGYVVEKGVNDTVQFKQVQVLPINSERFEDKNIDYFYITYRISPFVNPNGQMKKANYKELLLNRHQPLHLNFRLETEKNAVINYGYIPFTYLPVTGYELERWESTSAVSYNERNYKLVANITDLSTAPGLYIDTTLLKDGHFYDFRIRAYNKDGKSLYTKSQCCYSGTFDVLPPNITTLQQVNLNTITLHWKYSDNRASRVIVERSETDHENFEELDRLDPSETSYKDQGLNPQITYFYRCRTLGSKYSPAVKVVHQTGISEYKRFTSGGTIENVSARPGVDEIVTTFRSVSASGLKLWRTSENTPYDEISFSSPISDVTFTSDGQYMVLGFWDGYVRTYVPGDLTTYAYSMAKTDAKVTGVSVLPNSNTAAIGYSDGTILLMKFTSFGGDPATVQRVLQDLESISDLQFSSNGNSLVASDSDGTLVIYDVSGNYQLHSRKKAHSDVITQLAISNDNKMIATVSQDNSVKLWNKNNLNQITQFTYQDFSYYQSRFPLSVEFSKNDNLLFVGTTHKTLLIWNIGEGELHQILHTRSDELSESVSDLAINDDGTYLYSAGYSEIILWELKKQWIKIEH